MHTLDLTLFFAVYELSGHWVWLDVLIIVADTYLLYLILGAVAYYTFWEWFFGYFDRVYGYLIAVVGALVARFGVAEIIRHFYHRPRPFLALHLPQHLLTDTSYSFPSGHTIFLFALATGVCFVNKRFGLWLFMLGALVGVARVAGGVHYPSDIVGGAMLGICTSWAVYAFWKLLRRSINVPYI